MAHTRSKIISESTSYIVYLLREGTESVPRFAEQVTRLSRPGLVGSDYALAGRKARPFRVHTLRDAQNASEARQIAQACDALKGAVVSYVDETMREWENVMVLDVRSHYEFRPTTGDLYPAYDPVYPNTTSSYVVRTRWLLELTVDDQAE